MATAEAKATGLAQDVEKSRLQILRAPVNGKVQQLAVHTVGGVVTPAQALLEVVPLDSRLEIEAMVQNRDIGFVRAGQPAEIKVDTFNFTKYGALHGTVLNVSAASIDRSKPGADTDNKASSGSADSASEPRGRELVYAAHFSVDRTVMDVDGRDVPLSPGMAVTVEIKSGAQRYLFSPLLRFTNDNLHERRAESREEIGVTRKAANWPPSKWRTAVAGPLACHCRGKAFTSQQPTMMQTALIIER